MKGIILSKGTKSEFESMNITDRISGTVVLATDTNEVGVISSEKLYIWRKWQEGDSNSLKHDGELITLDDGGLFVDSDGNEHYLDNGELLPVEIGISEQRANEILEPNWHNAQDFPFIGQYDNLVTATVTKDEDIITNTYVDDVLVADNIQQKGKVIGNIDFSEAGINSKTIVNLNYLMEHPEKFPNEDPCDKGMAGVLWTPNGGADIILSGSWSNGEQRCRVFEIIVQGEQNGDNDPTISMQVPLGQSVTREFFDMDHPNSETKHYAIRFSSNEPITSFKLLAQGSSVISTNVNIIKFKTVTSMNEAFMGMNNLGSFTCPFDQTENVTDFSNAFNGCSIPAGQFPSIDVSSSNSFVRTWYNCPQLLGANCPGTDGTLVIPTGADTTEMCGIPSIWGHYRVTSANNPDGYFNSIAFADGSKGSIEFLDGADYGLTKMEFASYEDFPLRLLTNVVPNDQALFIATGDKSNKRMVGGASNQINTFGTPFQGLMEDGVSHEFYIKMDVYNQ